MRDRIKEYLKTDATEVAITAIQFQKRFVVWIQTELRICFNFLLSFLCTTDMV